MKKLFLIVWFVPAAFALAQVSKPLQFKEESFDFGQVVEKDGPVLHQFEFTNGTARPVKILNVKPSCGCTTPGWTKEPIMPGKTGFIQAQFDPKGRPGYFAKTLAVTTDADAGTITLQVKGTVVSESKTIGSDFNVASGNWKIKSGALNLGKVFLKDEFVTREIEIVNAGTKAITYLNKFEAPAHIRITTEPVTLLPGAKGVIKLAYNGKLKNRYGFQSDKVVLHTDDTDTPLKSFSVFATLEDHFPEVASPELAKVPRLKLGATTVDFGRIKQNQSAVREILVSNLGKLPLELRSVQGNCECMVTVADKTVLKPGESTAIKVTFNAEDRKGTQQKSATVYSNDPQNPVQRVTFMAYIEE
jgi:hypothetical protein